MQQTNHTSNHTEQGRSNAAQCNNPEQAPAYRPERVEGLTILVTGVNGFIGRRLAAQLCRLGFIVHGLDVAVPAEQDQIPLANFYEQDIAEAFHLTTAFDYVFHLAALNLTNVGQASNDDFHQINVQGTRHVFEAVVAQHFVFMSTAKVYRQEGLPLEEHSPVDPIGLYEKSKWEAEGFLQSHGEEMGLTIFRPVNIVGPGQAPKALLPVLFERALCDHPLEIFAPRKTLMQLLHVDDAIDAFSRLLLRPSTREVINLAPADCIRLDSLAEKIVSLTHSSSAIFYTNDQPVVFSPVIARKAKDLLGWNARFQVEDILQDYQRSFINS